MPDFTDLIDLAAERLGGRALAANDEFFAGKENLLKPGRGVFVEGKYTEFGKWMDGWETRRRRTPGHDWCIIRLGMPGVVKGFDIDTNHFRGNAPEAASVEACVLDGDADGDPAAMAGDCWRPVLPRTSIQPHSRNLFPVADPRRWTHLRLNIFPDGGVARFRVHGVAVPDVRRLAGTTEPVDLAAVENGGAVLSASDMFFGSRHNLILPGDSISMGDGWESRRRRGPGHDWVIVRLAAAGTPERIVVDTMHFKGNYPESCSIEGCDAEGAEAEDLAAAAWVEILGRTRLEADRRHTYAGELRVPHPLTHLRLNIHPDGGVARFRVYGRPSPEGKRHLGLIRLNGLAEAEASAEFLRCCGSRRWASAMAGGRPFQSFAELLGASDRLWSELGDADRLEAWAAHPRIGERPADSTGKSWAAGEQSGARTASAETLAALAEGNRAYEAKFGFVFLIRATGRTTEEMLAALRERLDHDRGTELQVAAEQQRQITRLRLEKLVQP
ncbi:MAG: allantoicase [Planctomycetes bacterium]|nr:allantoicase [Planctomycetota bacterium]